MTCPERLKIAFFLVIQKSISTKNVLVGAQVIYISLHTRWNADPTGTSRIILILYAIYVHIFVFYQCELENGLKAIYFLCSFATRLFPILEACLFIHVQM